MFNFLKFFSSSQEIGGGDAGKERTGDNEIMEMTRIVEEPPKIMVFREVAAPSNRVGDIFWLPAQDPGGKKCLAVNFDFDMCGWKG